MQPQPDTSTPMRMAAVRDPATGAIVHRLVPAIAAPAPKGKKKHVPDPIKANPEAAAQQLAQFIDRAERMMEEISGMQDDLRDVFAEAKANGYDTKGIKAIIARRKKSKDVLQEEEAILETYETALGIA